MVPDEAGTSVLDIPPAPVVESLAVPCLDWAPCHFYCRLELTAENDWLKFLEALFVCDVARLCDFCAGWGC